jgi:hypothetical protein
VEKHEVDGNSLKAMATNQNSAGTIIEHSQGRRLHIGKNPSVTRLGSSLSEDAVYDWSPYLPSRSYDNPQTSIHRHLSPGITPLANFGPSPPAIGNVLHQTSVTPQANKNPRSQPLRATYSPTSQPSSLAPTVPTKNKDSVLFTSTRRGWQSSSSSGVGQPQNHQSFTSVRRDISNSRPPPDPKHRKRLSERRKQLNQGEKKLFHNARNRRMGREHPGAEAEFSAFWESKKEEMQTWLYHQGHAEIDPGWNEACHQYFNIWELDLKGRKAIEEAEKSRILR